MSPHPLALSDAQLSIIRDCAQQLPVERRSRYFEAVADQLMGIHSLTNDDVETAARRVLARIGVIVA
jgi:hypothetical protein